jgi:threonine/homoserine/homoserine lactone efflux protein
MIAEIIRGIILGLSLAAPPGPVNAMIAHRSLTSSARGILVGLGALSADLIFMTIMLMIKAIIPSVLLKSVGIIGSVFMFYLAVQVLRAKENNDYERQAKKKELSSTYTKDYATGLAMGLTNPFQITWWLTAGLSLIASFGYTILVGFIIGIISWVFSFSTIISKGRTNKTFILGVKLFSSITLLFFSIYIFIRFGLS